MQETLPLSIAAVAGVLLLLILPFLGLVPRLRLGGWPTAIGHLSSGVLLFCCLLIAGAMLAGLVSDWSEGSKTAMFLGFVLLLPAVPAALALVALAAISRGSKGARWYVGLTSLTIALLLAVPALVMSVLVTPGKP